MQSLLLGDVGRGGSDDDIGTTSVGEFHDLGNRVLDGCIDGVIWVDGSRAYRTLDDYQLPMPAFEAMRASGDLRLVVPTDFSKWYEERRTLLARRMTEVERAAAAGELVDMTIERGQLLISSIRRSPSDDADALKARLYAMLPRVRITDLLVEVAAWSGFADRFVHARSGAPASDQSALMGAILADATNLGLSRMAAASQGVTRDQLLWTHDAYIRDDSYCAALAVLIAGGVILAAALALVVLVGLGIVLAIDLTNGGGPGLPSAEEPSLKWATLPVNLVRSGRSSKPSGQSKPIGRVR